MTARRDPSGDGAEHAIDPDILSPEVRGALERLSTGLLDILARIERHEAERRDDQRQRGAEGGRA